MEKSLNQLEEFIRLLSKTVQTTHDSVLLFKQSQESMAEVQSSHSKDISDLKESKSKIQGGWFALSTSLSILAGFAGLAFTIYKMLK